MNDALLFIIDLNEVEDDLVPVSIDFTVNYGPFVNVGQHMPTVGSTVYLHSDEDDTIYYGIVGEIVDDRDFIAQVDWQSCTPVLNREWSAGYRGESMTAEEGPQTAGSPGIVIEEISPKADDRVSLAPLSPVDALRGLLAVKTRRDDY